MRYDAVCTTRYVEPGTSVVIAGRIFSEAAAPRVVIAPWRAKLAWTRATIAVSSSPDVELIGPARLVRRGRCRLGRGWERQSVGSPTTPR
jgi:hypothetical protein